MKDAASASAGKVKSAKGDASDGKKRFEVKKVTPHKDSQEIGDEKLTWSSGMQ